MTDNLLLEPIDFDLAKKQWNDYMKKRTKIRKFIRAGIPTKEFFKGELKAYNQILTGKQYREVRKIIVQCLKGNMITKEKVN